MYIFCSGSSSSALIDPLLDTGLPKYSPVLPVSSSTVFTISSSHLLLGVPRPLFPSLGHQSVVLTVHLSSLILATCPPAHLHFCPFTDSITSLIPVFSRIHLLVFRSL